MINPAEFKEIKRAPKTPETLLSPANRGSIPLEKNNQGKCDHEEHALEASTHARRTMREMDRRSRPEVADDLEHSRENLVYKQLDTASDRLGAILGEMASVVGARDLAILRKQAEDRARITRDPGLVGRAKEDDAWNDLGALKRFLFDDLIRERNAYARKVMRDVRQRQGKPVTAQ